MPGPLKACRTLPLIRLDLAVRFLIIICGPIACVAGAYILGCILMVLCPDDDDSSASIISSEDSDSAGAGSLEMGGSTYTPPVLVIKQPAVEPAGGFCGDCGAATTPSEAFCGSCGQTVKAAPAPIRGQPIELWEAAQAGNTATLERLLAAGVDQNWVLLARAYYPIFAKVGLLESLYHKCAHLLDQANPDERSATPLCIASVLGHTRCVELLLTTSGTDPRIGDKIGWTPLHYAAAENQVIISDARVASCWTS